MSGRVMLERQERKQLNPYACFSDDAARIISVKKDPYRTEFQRDRDRILHAKAFRRLECKTQVFLPSINDHIRTRLTHSLEVSQLGRAVAVQLGLNADLVEAIALGHDLGHAPFGHAGEKELQRLTTNGSGYSFKHNVQSIKILTFLEKQYDYDGLRPTIAVLEGILKHTELPTNLPEYCSDLYIDKLFSVTLEGQIIAIVDEIAQITHDMDDYLRENIITIDYFIKSELFDLVKEFYGEKHNFDIESKIIKDKDIDRQHSILIRCLIDYLITTLIEETRTKLDSSLRAYSLDKIYVDFDYSVKKVFEEFHEKLDEKLISTKEIKEMDERGRRTIEALYNFYTANPEKLYSSTYKLYKRKGASVIVDFISGMTDRFAAEECSKIFQTN